MGLIFLDPGAKPIMNVHRQRPTILFGELFCRSEGKVIEIIEVYNLFIIGARKPMPEHHFFCTTKTVT